MLKRALSRSLCLLVLVLSVSVLAAPPREKASDRSFFAKVTRLLRRVTSIGAHGDGIGPPTPAPGSAQPTCTSTTTTGTTTTCEP